MIKICASPQSLTASSFWAIRRVRLFLVSCLCQVRGSVLGAVGILTCDAALRAATVSDFCPRQLFTPLVILSVFALILALRWHGILRGPDLLFVTGVVEVYMVFLVVYTPAQSVQGLWFTYWHAAVWGHSVVVIPMLCGFGVGTLFREADV